MPGGTTYEPRQWIDSLEIQAGSGTIPLKSLETHCISKLEIRPVTPGKRCRDHERTST